MSRAQDGYKTSDMLNLCNGKLRYIPASQIVSILSVLPEEEATLFSALKKADESPKHIIPLLKLLDTLGRRKREHIAKACKSKKTGPRATTAYPDSRTRTRTMASTRRRGERRAGTRGAVQHTDQTPLDDMTDRLANTLTFTQVSAQSPANTMPVSDLNELFISMKF